MRWLLFTLLILHGLIHGFGVAKAFGLAKLPQLTQPISRALGLLWLAASVAMIASAVALIVRPASFWWLGAFAIVLSQIAILSAWQDAKVGSIANLIALLGVAYGFASHGPSSLRAEYLAQVSEALQRTPAGRTVHENDLRTLPDPVQRYIRISGAVGLPQIASFRATWRGRIRASTADAWMDFRGEQINVYEENAPSRLFFMDATMKHLPVDVFHRFVGESATFRVRVLSAFTMVDARGPVMDHSETVTLFNDLCILAPSRLIDPNITWEPIDAFRARAHYTRGKETITADLIFNDQGELVDFYSDDRSAASSDGKSFVSQRWTTPLRNYRSFGQRRVMSSGEARWEPPSGAFTYIELELEDIEYNTPL